MLRITKKLYNFALRKRRCVPLGSMTTALRYDIWKVGRVNDCAGLEIRYTLSGIGGLNPSLSAQTKYNCLTQMLDSFFMRQLPQGGNERHFAL